MIVIDARIDNSNNSTLAKVPGSMKLVDAGVVVQSVILGRQIIVKDALRVREVRTLDSPHGPCVRRGPEGLQRRLCRRMARVDAETGEDVRVKGLEDDDAG